MRLQKQMSFAKSQQHSQKKQKTTLVHTNGTKKSNFKSKALSTKLQGIKGVSSLAVTFDKQRDNNPYG